MANFVLNDLKRVFLAKGNALKQLIIINVVVFFLFGITDNLLTLFQVPFQFTPHFLLESDPIKLLKQPWGFFTYMWFHGGFWHILGNMLWLYFLGRILQDFLGPRKVINAFVLGGLAGGLLFVLIYNFMNIVLPGNEYFRYLPMLGASGAVLSVVLAAATLRPDHTLHLFLIGPVRIKYLALFSLLMTFMSDTVYNPGGLFAHLGGAFIGYAYIRGLQNGKDYGRPIDWVLDRLSGEKKPRMKKAYSNPNRAPRNDREYTSTRANEQRKIDAILDKISKSGYDSLSKEEKEFLFSVSNKK